MGTTLHAQVEVFSPGDRKNKRESWWELLSRWDFGKDYAASLLVTENSLPGWPSDPCFSSEELVIFDQGGQRWLPSNLPKLPKLPNATVLWESFTASVEALSATDFRILFWSM